MFADGNGAPAAFGGANHKRSGDRYRRSVGISSDIVGNDRNYIMVVAPSMSHIMSIIPEGDANHYNNSSSKPIQLSDGLYHLDFRVEMWF